LKNHRPVHLQENTPSINRGSQTRQIINTTAAATAAAPPHPNTRNILTRNMIHSQPIFSVSSIFGLKQGSCKSCGH
jgi:hypothetical protein